MRDGLTNVEENRGVLGSRIGSAGSVSADVAAYEAEIRAAYKESVEWLESTDESLTAYEALRDYERIESIASRLASDEVLLEGIRLSGVEFSAAGMYGLNAVRAVTHDWLGNSFVRARVKTAQELLSELESLGFAGLGDKKQAREALMLINRMSTQFGDHMPDLLDGASSLCSSVDEHSEVVRKLRLSWSALKPVLVAGCSREKKFITSTLIDLQVSPHARVDRREMRADGREMSLGGALDMLGTIARDLLQVEIRLDPEAHRTNEHSFTLVISKDNQVRGRLYINYATMHWAGDAETKSGLIRGYQSESPSGPAVPGSAYIFLETSAVSPPGAMMRGSRGTQASQPRGTQASQRDSADYLIVDRKAYFELSRFVGLVLHAFLNDVAFERAGSFHGPVESKFFAAFFFELVARDWLDAIDRESRESLLPLSDLSDAQSPSPAPSYAWSQVASLLVRAGEQTEVFEYDELSIGSDNRMERRASTKSVLGENGDFLNRLQAELEVLRINSDSLVRFESEFSRTTMHLHEVVLALKLAAEAHEAGEYRDRVFELASRPLTLQEWGHQDTAPFGWSLSTGSYEMSHTESLRAFFGSSNPGGSLVRSRAGQEGVSDQGSASHLNRRDSEVRSELDEYLPMIKEIRAHSGQERCRLDAVV